MQKKYNRFKNYKLKLKKADKKRKRRRQERKRKKKRKGKLHRTAKAQHKYRGL